MAFFVSDELKGKIFEEDLFEKKNNSPISSNLYFKLTTKENINLYFDLKKITFKKNKINLKFHVDQNFQYFNNLININTINSICLVENVENAEYNIWTCQSTFFKTSKIKRINSGYNYCITIVIYKNT
jgi:hypothetical protein